MNAPRHLWFLSLALALVLREPIAGLAQDTPESSLLNRATRICDVKEWAGTGHKYHWLNDHQLLFYRRDHEQDQIQERLFRYDLATKQAKYLDRLTRAFHGELYENWDNLQVSPDGQWVLWKSETGSKVCGARLDGTAYFQCTPEKSAEKYDPHPASRTELLWASDPRHWFAVVEQQGTTRALRYKVTVPNSPEILPVSTPDRVEPMDMLGLLTTQSLVKTDRFLGFGWHENQHRTESVDIVQVGIDHPEETLRRHHIKLPPNSVIQSIVISPSGQRIAWLLTDKVFFQASESEAKWPVIETLWISLPNGTQMQKVGQYVHTAATYSLISELAWVPGEKRLSFLYKDALWTVPANGEADAKE